MNTTLCTGCEELVIHATNGRVLEPKPHPLGVMHPDDGEPYSQRAHAQLVQTTGLGGHRDHHCPTGQAELFDTQEAVIR